MTAMMPLIVTQVRSILASVPSVDRDALRAIIIDNVVTADEVPNVDSERANVTTEVCWMQKQQRKDSFQDAHEDETFVDAPEAKATPSPDDWRRLLPPEWCVGKAHFSQAVNNSCIVSTCTKTMKRGIYLQVDLNGLFK